MVRDGRGDAGGQGHGRARGLTARERHLDGQGDSLRGVRPPFCSAVVLSLCLSLAGVEVHAAPAAKGSKATGASKESRAAASAAESGASGATGAGGATDEAARLAVLPLRVEGSIDGETRERWTAGLREGLGRGQAALVDPAQVTPFLEGNCDRQTCYDRVRANSGATHLVRTTVVAKNRDFILKLDLIDAKTGVVVLSEDETCEICGSTELVSLLDSQGALLQSRLSAMSSGPAVLVLDTRPGGALVFVDGEVVGTTPLERPVLEGSHKIRVSLNGYVAEERELTLVNGAREELQLTLQRTPGNPKSRALGAVGLAGGLLLLGAGVGLVAIDDREYKKTCVGDGVDADGDCKSLFGTGPLGAVLIGVGAILGTVGVVALVRNRNANPKRAALMPTGLGLAGRF